MGQKQTFQPRIVMSALIADISSFDHLVTAKRFPLWGLAPRGGDGTRHLALMFYDRLLN